MKELKSFLKSLVAPIVVLLAAGSLIYFGFINHLSIQSINYFTITIFFISLILCVWFNKSRFFFILLLYLLVYLFRYYLYNYVSGINKDLVFTLLSFIILLNLIVFSIIRERGILSFWGKVRFLFLILEGIGFWLVISHAGFLNAFYDQYIRTRFLLTYPYIQIILVTLGISFYIILSVYQDNYYGAFVGLLITPLLPFFYENRLLAWSVFYSAAALITTIEIIIDMYKMAYLDELTGLAARRALRQDTMKLSNIYTIAMLDIDFFKKVNDRYGHDVGDQVLKFVAALAKKVTGGGKPYRYGGEEFTLVFPGKKKEEVLPHLEALRRNIAERPFVIRAKNRPKTKPESIDTAREKNKTEILKIHVTVSIGVSDNHIKNATPQDIIKEADKALYKAKKAGRNRVCV